MLPMAAKRHVMFAMVVAGLLAVGTPAPAQTLLRLKFQPGESLRYVETQTMTQKMPMSDKIPTTTTTTKKHEETWKVESVDAEGVATITQMFNRMQQTMQGPQGVLVEYDTASDKELEGRSKTAAQMADAMVNKPWVVKMTPRGEVLAAKTPQGLRESMKKILPDGDQMGDFSSPEGLKKMRTTMMFPEEPVVKGQTWSHKMDFNAPAMYDGVVTAEHKYEYLGTELRDGIELQKIAVTLQMGPAEEKQPEEKKPVEKQATEKKAEGKGAAKKRPGLVTLKSKQNMAEGTVYFDNVRGRIVEETMKMKMQMEINLPGMHGTLDTEGTMRNQLQPADSAAQQPKP